MRGILGRYPQQQPTAAVAIGPSGKRGDRQLATVTVRSGESYEDLLRRFRKQVTDDKILSVYRQKRWYVSKSELKRKAKRRGLRKMRQQQRRMARRLE